MYLSRYRESPAPIYKVIGYRALAVDFSENARFGENALDDGRNLQLVDVGFRPKRTPLAAPFYDRSSPENLGERC